MISMANRHSAADRRAIAEFITGKSFAHPLDTAPAKSAMCTAPAPAFGDPSSGPLWNGWGQNLLNTRFQTAAQAGLIRRRRRRAQSEVGIRISRYARR